MKIRIIAAALLAAPVLAFAQGAATDAPKPAAPAAKGGGPVATVNGVAVSQQRAEALLRQQLGRGARDGDQLRAAVREDLINREIIAQEAAKTGLGKKAEVQAQIDLARQEVLVNAYIGDYVRVHPVTDGDVQKEYERAKTQTGDKEYKARHILVESEDAAKGLIADLKKGGKFEELAAKNSRDEGTKDRGGDLDWNVTAVFDKPFSDALAKLEKGQTSEAPVRSRYGFHVIRLEDVRPVKFPTLAEVKPRIQQQLMQRKIEELVRGLRSKAKVE